NVCDSDRGRCGNQVNKGKLIHEIMQQPAVFDQMRLGNVKRFGAMFLGFKLYSGQGESGYQVATFHERLLWLRITSYSRSGNREFSAVAQDAILRVSPWMQYQQSSLGSPALS